MKTIKTFIAVVMIVVLSVSCKSIPEQPKIPTLEAIRPVRPVLIPSVESDALETNVIRLMGYSEEMEIYADALEAWQRKISEILTPQP